MDRTVGKAHRVLDELSPRIPIRSTKTIKYASSTPMAPTVFVTRAMQSQARRAQ